LKDANGKTPVKRRGNEVSMAPSVRLAVSRRGSLAAGGKSGGAACLKTFRLRRPPLSPAGATRSPTWTRHIWEPIAKRS